MEMKRLLRANSDRLLAVTLVLAGVLALIVGWIGMSGTGLAAQQNPYLISGGLGGLGLIAIGCTIWISADLQDEWRRLDSLERIRPAQVEEEHAGVRRRGPGPDGDHARRCIRGSGDQEIRKSGDQESRPIT